MAGAAGLMEIEATKTEEKPMQYQDVKPKISRLKVQSIAGKNVSLPSLWKDRRILLVFLRHFG